MKTTTTELFARAKELYEQTYRNGTNEMQGWGGAFGAAFYEKLFPNATPKPGYDATDYERNGRDEEVKTNTHKFTQRDVTPGQFVCTVNRPHRGFNGVYRFFSAKEAENTNPADPTTYFEFIEYIGAVPAETFFADGFAEDYKPGDRFSANCVITTPCRVTKVWRVRAQKEIT